MLGDLTPYEIYVLSLMPILGVLMAHSLKRYLFRRKPRADTITASEARVLYKELDPTKRRSLQPGSKIRPLGWTEERIVKVVPASAKRKNASDFLAAQAKARESRAAQVIEDKAKQELRDLEVSDKDVVPQAAVERAGSRKPTQPGVEPYSYEKAANEQRTVNHIFFGSQLTVDGILVCGSLAKIKHRLEITKNNQVFIDNMAIALNPDTVIRVKRELYKLQNPQT